MMWEPVAALAVLFLLNVIIQSIVTRRLIRREFDRRDADARKYVSVAEAQQLAAGLMKPAGAQLAPDLCPTCRSHLKTVRRLTGTGVPCPDAWHARVW